MDAVVIAIVVVVVAWGGDGERGHRRHQRLHRKQFSVVLGPDTTRTYEYVYYLITAYVLFVQPTRSSNPSLFAFETTTKIDVQDEFKKHTPEA